MAHAPSQARALRRALQDPDADPDALLEQALALDDDAHRAPVLARLAGDPRLQGPKGLQALEAALRAAEGVERPSQKAEVWEAVFQALPAPAPKAAVEAAVADVDRMPDGEWTLEAVTALADRVGPDGRPALLERALRNRGFEADGAKAVLAAADLDRETGLRERAEGIDDPDLRRKVLGYLGHQGEAGMDAAIEAAWTVPDRNDRLEALRAVAWNCTSLEDLDAVAVSADGRDPDEAARLLCACAARADRFHDLERTTAWIGAATGLAARLEDPKARKKVANKIRLAAEKAGLEAPDLPDDPPPPMAEASTAGRTPAAATTEARDDSLPPPSGHVLAVVDAYRGGLSSQHLRTAARAAALCVAFGHDLWLVDFPADDAAALVQAARAETRIGEDADPLGALQDAGRMRVLSGLPDDVPGRLVATTPHPDPERTVDLETLSGPVVLLVGTGAQGLAKALLDRADGHYELTGRRVSLETASAMGILADRLARVPAPTGS